MRIIARLDLILPAVVLILTGVDAPEARSQSANAERMVRMIDKDHDGTVDLKARAATLPSSRERIAIWTTRADVGEFLGLLTSRELQDADPDRG